MKGTIKNYNDEKNFGFIRGEDGKEYFFHSSAVVNGAGAELSRGREVTFQPSEGAKGPRAEEVEL